MNASDFKPLEGKQLQAKTEDGREIELTLDKVETQNPEESGERPEDIRQEPFTLLFSCPEEQYFSDQIVELNWEGTSGPQDIFLKPLDKNGSSYIYEAVFN